MCGIVGTCGTHIGRQVVEDMTDSLAHRGPDDRGVWESSVFPVRLGHRRLSIIDLSDTGSQPMVDAARGLALVYNGELYNTQDVRDRLAGLGHRFSGHSDTEVVFRAYMEWRTECVKFLSGMFAFAFADEREREARRGGRERSAAWVKVVVPPASTGQAVDTVLGLSPTPGVIDALPAHGVLHLGAEWRAAEAVRFDAGLGELLRELGGFRAWVRRPEDADAIVPFWPEQPDWPTLGRMRKTFDPKHRLNPGRFP